MFLIFAMALAYLIVYRTGENVVWAIKGAKGDPPSFRRWQERQKRKGARGSITGRAEGRKFWAHVWHDAHASAHEWRQRRRGRSWEERRKRWQAEDVQRQQNLPLAPCVFCGAGRGEDCSADCPESQAHDANRANPSRPDRATEPTKSAATEPSDGTVPSQQDTTEPAEPSHTDGTVPTTAEPTEPEPSHVGDPDRATPVRASEPNRAIPEATTEPSGDHATPAEPATSGNHLDKERARLARDEEELDSLEQIYPPKRNSLCYERISQLQQSILYRRSMLGLNPDGSPKDATAQAPDTEQGNVTSINKNRPAANQQAGNGNTSGGNVTTPNVTGEIQGYEATLAEMDQTIAHLEADHADADQKVAAFEGLDAVYETRINALRAANADEETIGTQVAAREANETQISAAKARLEAASVHLEAETAARARWVEGQGAKKETADAVGARGDQVLID